MAIKVYVSLGAELKTRSAWHVFFYCGLVIFPHRL